MTKTTEIKGFITATIEGVKVGWNGPANCWTPDQRQWVIYDETMFDFFFESGHSLAKIVDNKEVHFEPVEVEEVKPVTNLEAFIKAFCWNGGTIHQVDEVIRPALKASGKRSITELEGLDDWLDLVICSYTTLNATDCAVYCRTAYMVKFGCLKGK